MLEAAFWSLLAAASLLIGVEIALGVRPGRETVGLVMAFGVGALISAVAYDLVLEAVEKGQHLRVLTGMALGSLTFLVGETLIERAGREKGKSSPGTEQEGSPLAIVLGAVLDGLPESVIIGLSIVLMGSVSLSFVAAAFISNLPEAMAATSGLATKGWAPSHIRKLWLGVVGISGLAGAMGYLIFNSQPESTGAFFEGFAAGALLTMVADTMAPEAYQFAGKLAGVFTVAGFVLAFAIGGA